MHGLVFTYVQKFVQKEFGNDVWKALIANAGVGGKSYSPAKSYPDEDAVAIVAAAAKLLELPAQEVLTTIGRGIAPDLMNLYRSRLPSNWGTIDLIENVEGIIHSAVRVGNPGAHPPVLDCVRDGQDKIQIIYSSHRQMCGLLRGIVDGVARHYREVVTIEKTACMLEGAPYCVFEVTKIASYDDALDANEKNASDNTQVIESGDLEKQANDTRGLDFSIAGTNPMPLDTSIQADINAIKLLGHVNTSNQLSMINHFRVVRLLGAGGMGIVYQAEDTRLGRTVAVKLLRPSLLSNESIRLRFLREAKAMVAIDCPQVATVFDIGAIGDLPFMVMECLQGMTLEEKLNHGARILLPEVIRIGTEIAYGVQALHRAGYIHRDLKPGNVWLESPSDRVKLLDFGVVRAITKQSGNATGITRSGGVIGTPSFMAPEQVRGEESIDVRCDIFSLGCILYWMLCGQQAFSTKDHTDEFPTLSNDPVAPNSLSGTPKAISDFVMSMLEKDKSSRPGSIDEVLTRLDQLKSLTVGA